MIVRGARDIHANRHVHGQRCDVHTARDVPMVNVGVGCPDDLQTGSSTNGNGRYQFFCHVYVGSRCGELRTQKLKSYLVRRQSLNVLPLKPGIGQYIAIHAVLTARDFFLAHFYPFGPFT